MDAFEGTVQRNAVNFSGGRTFLSSFRSDLKETLLPDDPFRHLKGRPAASVAVGLLRYFVPILEWAPRYSFAKFRYDLLAGVTIASLAIPQGISYARLANLPPIIGLCKNVASAYTSAICSEKNDFDQFDDILWQIRVSFPRWSMRCSVAPPVWRWGRWQEPRCSRPRSSEL